MAKFQWVFAYLIILLFIPATLRAKDFEVFDGQVYNGKFYPRIDIIEWTYAPNPSHMEFHIYSKGKPIDMAFQLERKNKKVVMLVKYMLQDRGESLCRRVLAPGHFLENFYVYRDNTDPDFDNVIVTMNKLPEKIGRNLLVRPFTYASCEVEQTDRLPAANQGFIAPPPSDQKKTKTDKGAIKGAGQSVPFSDW